MAGWRCNKKSTQERLALLLNNEILSNVTFLVSDKDREPQKLFAHTFILAVGSEVFEAMFYGALADWRRDIPIPDATPEGFLTMLQYLYTNEVEFKSMTNAIETYHLATKYDINDLQDLCYDYVEDSLEPENACEVYEFARFIEDDPLKQECHKIFRLQTAGVLSSESFKTAELSTVKMIIMLPWLAISEYELFNSVLEWAQNTASRKGLDQDSENLRAIMQPLLPDIRFLAMSVTEVASSPVEKGILTSTEAYAILLRLVKPNTTVGAMPEPFSLNTKPRSSNLNTDICRILVTSDNTKNSNVSAETTFILQLSIKGTDAFVTGIQLPLNHLDSNTKCLTLTASVKCINVATREVSYKSKCKCQVYCAKNHDRKDGEINFSKLFYLERCTVVEFRVNLQGEMDKCDIKTFEWYSPMPRVIYNHLELNISFPEQQDAKDCFPLSAISFYC